MAQIHRAVGLGVDKILNHLLRPDAAADRGPLSLAGELHRPSPVLGHQEDSERQPVAGDHPFDRGGIRLQRRLDRWQSHVADEEIKHDQSVPAINIGSAAHRPAPTRVDGAKPVAVFSISVTNPLSTLPQQESQARPVEVIDREAGDLAS
jgi:hypothetical protein